MEIFERPPHQTFARLTAAETFTKIEMQDGTAGVFALQLVLHFQRQEGVVGESDREL